MTNRDFNKNFKVKPALRISKANRTKIKRLISKICMHSPYYYHKYSSYALKEIFENLGSLYVSVEEFVEIMEEMGFVPMWKRNEYNPYFKVLIIPTRGVNSCYWGKGGMHLWGNYCGLGPITNPSSLKLH